MSNRNESQAGGVLLALFIMAGAVIGTIMRQPSTGVLIGTGAGIAAAVAIWLRDRARRGD